MRVAAMTPCARTLLRLLVGYEAGLISRGMLRRLWRAAILEHHDVA